MQPTHLRSDHMCRGLRNTTHCVVNYNTQLRADLRKNNNIFYEPREAILIRVCQVMDVYTVT
jgi:hypothetical protein